MTLSARIAKHIPLLRRYARALTGSQQSGDTIVKAMLEALLQDLSSFPEGAEDKIALYTYFTRFYNRLSLPNEAAPSPLAWEQSVTDHLKAVPSRAKQAFLLHAVEEMSHNEIAQVLDTSDDMIQDLLDTCVQEISEQIAARVMIIEDEPLIAMDLEYIVKSLGHTVTGVARTHKEATALAKSSNPTLVLSDIQLADGSSGLDAVNDILKDMEVPVIFITGFPERLLTGEKPEPAYLVTKPFHPDAIKALISQALFFDDKAVVEG